MKKIKFPSELPFLRKALAVWWVLIGACKFRVKYYDEDGTYRGISVLMPYMQALSYAEIFGGEVVVQFKNPHEH